MKVLFQAILIVLIVSFAPFLASESACASQVTGQSSADKCAQVCTCKPNTPMPNGWNGTVTEVGWYHGYNPRTLLHWPMPDLPPGAQVIEAKVELYCTKVWEQIEGQVAFAPLMASWNPNTVTYNTRPGMDTSKAVISDWPATGQLLQVDITSLARLWYAGTLPNYGIEAYAASSFYSGWVDFASPGYSTASRRPKLTVVATPEPSSVLLFGLAAFALLRRRRS